MKLGLRKNPTIHIIYVHILYNVCKLKLTLGNPHKQHVAQGNAGNILYIFEFITYCVTSQLIYIIGNIRI